MSQVFIYTIRDWQNSDEAILAVLSYLSEELEAMDEVEVQTHTIGNADTDFDQDLYEMVVQGNDNSRR